MRQLQGKMLLLSGALTSLLLLQACGQNSAAEGSGESFAAAAGASPEVDGLTQGQASVSPAPQASAEAPRMTGQPSPATEKPGRTPAALKPTALPSSASSAEPVAEATHASRKPSVEEGGSVPSPTAVPEATTVPIATKEPIATKAPKATNSPKATPVPTPAASPSPAAKVTETEGTAAKGSTEIGWNGFFDGDDQTRPSEHFWDLSGQQVTIKGFMGEVLSFEKNWFLLIPEPGAECPFDNGDETYWNKIMIVFVPEGSKLRYTTGPLEISGRLDVGIKIDESGYKTMFRLYDASFKSL
ncbi:hypothetical protein MHI24_13270 [Paenibacillus sp. FSL K6-1096]|uniref:hypothetical protein n=1 Tax=Paenibacillus sp. FSL K6-1096 TaxID=2921460 RepID=UPI0030EF092C